MARNDLKLLGGWFSPFPVKVHIALNIKGLEYELVEETLNPKSDLLLQSNPVYKKIPVLIHGDKPICESANIVEYIDEVWTNAPSILPTNAYDRALARFWAAYIDDKWFLSMRDMLTAKNDEAKRGYFEQLDEVVVRLEEVLKKCSQGKGFFGGDKIGFIDIVYGCYLSWMRVTEKMNGKKVLDESKTPALAKWAETFAADPAVKGLLPETDTLIEFAKVFQQKLLAAAGATPN
ncbi:Thioredoxin-like superfamily [Sesbania bispinosa]|nr:Thioredoxin-like superfamily [Sesbania bispinosa]